MFAKIRHVAIVSDQYALQGKFYESLFGMTTAAEKRSDRAVTVGDGYVGLNINPRKPGRPAGLDHFGLEVEDVELVKARLREKYPAIEMVQRPSTRPFAGITTHDPAGNIFDISQQGMENRTSVYVDAGQERENFISHIAIRTMNIEAVAQFYHEVYDLKLLPKKADDPNYYLTDGRVTLMLLPWSILDFMGTGIVRPGPDHIGFKVKSVEAIKERLQTLGDNNPHLRTWTLNAGKEGQARHKLFTKSACGEFHFCDVDGILIDVSEK
jgi:catechol 2,3-dioxygenase-like lactoylglutathione lyase family enzyme